jgi:hypothetical protein
MDERGFEDITISQDCIDHGDNWRAIFLEYEQLRKPNADAIAELAERNFMENELKTADENFFIAKRKLKNGSQTNILINGRRFIVWSLLVLLHTKLWLLVNTKTKLWKKC